MGAGLLFAQENEDAEFPLRYTGMAAGGYLQNEYMIGSYSDLAPCNLGLGGVFEYTSPRVLSIDADIGVSGRFEFTHLCVRDE